MKDLRERVNAGEILVADGALGSAILAAGHPPGASIEVLNIERPSLVEAISSSYLEAGARILQTNTFGASPLNLARHAEDGRTEEINRAAVRIARRAAADQAWVAASCGPSGRLLAPYGDTDLGAVADSFRRQISALAGEGVDLFSIETMTDAKEAAIAVRAAREVAPKIPVAASLTFDRTPRGFFTVMGTGVAAAARMMEEAGADIVGSNCGNGIDDMILVARELRSCTSLPLLIRPRARTTTI
ncbi:MAG: 5-methyltetrahydrofolate--homocysteine methyltransferase, partial [Candidatus Latescibacterota bacterium]